MDESGTISDERWRLGRRPALDGLRGVGVLMVLIGHAGLAGPFNDLHVFGVEVFFVLSGFLITSLLLEEHRANGGIDLLAFYRRRARRLGPALVVFLAGAGAIAYATGGWDRAAVARGQLSGLLYSANIFRIRSVSLGPFEHLWSLAVEEHFYIVLPALVGIGLWAGRRWGHTLVGTLFVGGIAASAALRVRWSDDWERVYNGSDTRAGSLLVGCVLALAMHGGLHRVHISETTRRLLVGGSPVLVLALSAVGAGSARVFLFTTALPAAAVASAVLVVAATVGQGRTARVLSLRPLRWTGELSYGLYLWHGPIYLLLGDRIRMSLPVHLAVVGIGLTFLAAMSSMVLIESRFLTRKPSVLVAWENHQWGADRRRPAPVATVGRHGSVVAPEATR